MSFIVEQDVENAALEILQEMGYEVVYAPEIAPDGSNPQRAEWDTVFVLDELEVALKKLNPDVPEDAIQEAIKKITKTSSHKIIVNNERFHEFVINGVEVEHREKGRIKNSHLKIFDRENPERNTFQALNQFTIIENKHNRRPDILIFINGLPVGIIELKNPASATATVKSAFDQVETYKDEIPSIFTYNEFVIIADGTEAKVGTITSPWEWFLPWKTIDGKKREPNSKPQLEVALKGMCNKVVIIDMIHNFIGYRKSKKDTIKIIAGYHQYHATNKAINSTIKVVGASKKVGVVWHTQGSGKSLTMAFYVGKITREPELKNPSIVVITDRNDLDDQLFKEFSAHVALFREEPKEITSQSKLKELLKVASGGIFFTTIQKFLDKTESQFELLSTRDNIVVVADEAHRTQYGFQGKIKKERLRYGFAKYLRDALPNASFLGFTGTPIDFADKSTRAIFGNYIDIYDMHAALEDKRVVPIYYDAELVPIGKNEEAFKELDEDFEEITEFEEQGSKDYLKSKWSRVENLVGEESRIERIAKKIVKNFELKQSVIEGKAIAVCMSRRICIDLHNAIKKIRPDWYSKDDVKGVMKIIMTGSAADGKSWQEHIRTKKKRREMGDLFKDPESEFKIAIVRDMWLTGFDVPSLNTIYVDKPIRHHNLMQAIARVNRVYKDKQGGLVVDFLGIADELKKAITIYTQSGGEGQPSYDIDVAIGLMKEKHEVVKAMLHGYNYQKFFKASAQDRMRIIPELKELILSQEKGKERFVKNTSGLIRALSLAAASPEAQDVREDAALFQVISNAFKKTDTGESRRTTLTDTAIKQLLSKAITTEGVIDIYRELGIQKPEIGILSDRFLDEFSNMQYKNLAFEALKKLLNDEIRVRFKDNKVKSKKFSEMLADAIRKYQNRSIDSAQVIAELIELAKEVREAQKRGDELGLTDEEVAFYDALADNDSARELLGDELLKRIARELTDLIKKNASIDWKLRETVKAKLRVMVKRLLKKYGYPPDKTAMATDLVLEQAELLSDKWSVTV
ncbi:type I restriction endonuclease subunit R [Candidatus Woesearchaeota archaeon]|nr:type I restriction endonuclease subunit R [Candidatus Woesearchaeota archaeon]